MKKEIRLNIKRDRKYNGCDYCKSTRPPTEKFIGYCGNVLYICTKCFKELEKRGSVNERD